MTVRLNHCRVAITAVGNWHRFTPGNELLPYFSISKNWAIYCCCFVLSCLSRRSTAFFAADDWATAGTSAAKCYTSACFEYSVKWTKITVPELLRQPVGVVAAYGLVCVRRGDQVGPPIGKLINCRRHFSSLTVRPFLMLIYKGCARWNLKVPGEIKRSRDLEEGGGAGPSS